MTIVLGVIVLVIAAIMLVPVGADVSYIGGNFSLSAKVCGLRLQLIPRKSAEEPSEPKKQKEKKKKPKEEAAAKPGKKFKPDFNRDELLSLVKAVLRGLGKFGKLTVDKFMLHFVSAGDDPYNTAATYNYVNAALSSLAPVCREKFIVKESDVWTDIDFEAEKMQIDVELCIVIRLGQLFRTAFAVLFGALGIFIKNRLRLGREKRQNKAEGGAEAAGISIEPEDSGDIINRESGTEEQTTENERTDSNG